MAILPPGVSAEQFDSAIRQFRNAVGEEWVFTSDEDSHAYRDYFSYIKDQPNELIPGAAVGPETVEQVAVERGNAKFQHSCAPCHGPGPGDDGRAMLPGMDAPRIKYKGEIPAVLEQRTDLPAPILKAFVRQGSFSIPPFRPTELTDAEIVDIAAYLAESSRASGSRR
jgi:mono/diheme cytochrome c family protein